MESAAADVAAEPERVEILAGFAKSRIQKGGWIEPGPSAFLRL